MSHDGQNICRCTTIGDKKDDVLTIWEPSGKYHRHFAEYSAIHRGRFVDQSAQHLLTVNDVIFPKGYSRGFYVFLHSQSNYVEKHLLTFLPIKYFGICAL